MKSLIAGSKINLKDLFEGDFFFLTPTKESQDLLAYCLGLIEICFEEKAEDISLANNKSDIASFVKKSTECKSLFTNSSKTKVFMKNLIISRYGDSLASELLFDLPRLRIIPESEVLSAGISYNYQPHRDSWYGAGQDQINHWMAVSNVKKESTFFVSPSYFEQPVINQSDKFDLKDWERNYRDLAAQNITKEERPHPLPLIDIPDQERLSIVIPPAWELAFSGTHLHGSSKSTNKKVRFSIDYRIYQKVNKYNIPENIDNNATGDFREDLFPVID
jgi:hypothetical protein